MEGMGTHFDFTSIFSPGSTSLRFHFEFSAFSLGIHINIVTHLLSQGNERAQRLAPFGVFFVLIWGRTQGRNKRFPDCGEPGVMHGYQLKLFEVHGNSIDINGYA